MWHRHYGRWWMVQWCYDGWVSLGVHLDFRHRRRGDGFSYGPYIDVHFLFWILSIGNNPLYAGEIELRASTAIEKELGAGVRRVIDVSLVLLLVVNLIEVSYVVLRTLGTARVGPLSWWGWGG